MRIFLFLLFAASINAQPLSHIEKANNVHIPTPKEIWGINKTKTASVFAVSFCGGLMNGTREVIIYDYPAFKRKHPGASDQYWNPDISWRNKYRAGNPELGEKFIFSKSLFVATTDAYHLLNTGSRIMLGGATFIIPLGGKMKWWEYAINFAAVNIGYMAGSQAAITYYRR